jgi:heat shock protein HslJ
VNYTIEAEDSGWNFVLRLEDSSGASYYLNGKPVPSSSTGIRMSGRKNDLLVVPQSSSDEFEPTRNGAALPVSMPLENTYWMLTHLGNAPVIASRGREPHLILNSANRGVGGSGGCNQLAGNYDLKGERLNLGQVISTLMACGEGMETESAFLEGLRQVNRWRIAGQELELLDAEEDVVARFKARTQR